MEQSKTNGIIHAMYLEYTGRKSTLLDSAVLAKASTDVLKDDEKVYALISVIKLYALAGFVPHVSVELSKKITMVNADKEEVIVDTEAFATEKDKAVELLKAVASQNIFRGVVDKKMAVFKELKSYYEEGKDFNSLINAFCSGKTVDVSVLDVAIKAFKKFIKDFHKEDTTIIDDNNLINVVMSEVLEDLEEIKALKAK